MAAHRRVVPADAARTHRAPTGTSRLRVALLLGLAAAVASAAFLGAVPAFATSGGGVGTALTSTAASASTARPNRTSPLDIGQALSLVKPTGAGGSPPTTTPPTTTPPTTTPPTTTPPAATPPPAATTTSNTTTATVGLLGPSTDQLNALMGSKVTRVVLPIGWDIVEPSQGQFNTGLLAQARSRLDAVRNAGFQVVLDLGLQYTPSWVFGLPGATRFVNQYGDVWHGNTSEDVPNAVFDPAVRAAEQDYINELASTLGAGSFAGVRIGGLLSGELRYPPSYYNGHQDSIWDYDAAAQANAPVPGWKPGSGTAADISSSLSYYFAGLTGYQTWQMQTVDAAFPGVNQQVMLPGWGLRPGMVDDAVAGGMTNRSVAEVNGLISAGLDWATQVKAIADSGINATVYTTWLDAPTQSSGVQGEAPVDYLASLAAQYNLPIAGENTGGGGTTALALCVQRARADHLTSFMYMSGGLIDNGSAGITLADLAGAASTLAG